MSVVLDPAELNLSQRHLVNRWLERQGSTREVAMVPIAIKGGYVHIVELARRRGETRDRSWEWNRTKPWPHGYAMRTRHRRLRIRTPFPMSELRSLADGQD